MKIILKSPEHHPERKSLTLELGEIDFRLDTIVADGGDGGSLKFVPQDAEDLPITVLKERVLQLGKALERERKRADTNYEKYRAAQAETSMLARQVASGIELSVVDGKITEMYAGSGDNKQTFVPKPKFEPKSSAPRIEDVEVLCTAANLNGDEIRVLGDSGKVIVSPAPTVIAELRAEVESLTSELTVARALAGERLVAIQQLHDLLRIRLDSAPPSPPNSTGPR